MIKQYMQHAGGHWSITMTCSDRHPPSITHANK